MVLCALYIYIEFLCNSNFTKINNTVQIIITISDYRHTCSISLINIIPAINMT